jgi:GNAT superfamily N-acetyltransferase
VEWTNAITQRTAAPEDEKFLCGLYGSTRQAEMSALPCTPETQQALLRMQFEAQRTHYLSAYPRADHSIVLAAGTPAGRLYVDRREIEMLIVDIALLTTFQGQGIGRTLVSELQREAASSGKTLTGHVGRWNPAAGFWRRLDFAVRDEDEMYFKFSWGQPRAGCRD